MAKLRITGRILDSKNRIGLAIILSQFLLTLMNPSSTNAYKILAACLPGKSHAMTIASILRELAGRGHEVHFLVGASFQLPFDPVEMNITMERFGSAEGTKINYEYITSTMTEQVLGKAGGITDIHALLEQFYEEDTTQLFVNSEPLFKRLEEIKFDIAVIDGIFLSNYQYLIPARLGIPWVTVSVMLTQFDVPTPALPSFVPHKLSSYSDVMTFKERLINTFYTLVPLISKGQDPSEKIMRKYRQYGNFQTSHDLVSKSLLFVTNRDPVMDYTFPSTANVIHAGGLTVRPVSGRPLPDRIEQFISSARQGVIMMTFGTLASHFRSEIAEKFMAAFSKLNDYRILWRFDNRDNLTISDNVLIADWLPQNDLLGDKRVKLFITHSGNNGQFESLYHAVPMIGFPIFVDQGYNARRIQEKGFGIAMNIHEFTSEELLENIKKVLQDPTYKAKITKASEIYRSAKETAAERAAYYIEHVTRFGGEHLRASGANLNVFQYLMLDIIAFVLFCGLVILIVVVYIVKTLTVKYCYAKSSMLEKRASPKSREKLSRHTKKTD